MKILDGYFKGQSQRSEEITNYIMENRDEVERESISRKIIK